MPGTQGATWRATTIATDAASKMQVNAGIMMRAEDFDLENPTQVDRSKILFETTGDYSFTSQPTTSNFFEGVNNAPTNVKEGLQIDEWTNTLTITALSITEETLLLALGAANGMAETGISGRVAFKDSDFQKLYWLGDMADPTTLFVIELDNAVSTGGIQFSATNRGKGGMSLTFTAFATVAKPEDVPMKFYKLKKA